MDLDSISARACILDLSCPRDSLGATNLEPPQSLAVYYEMAAHRGADGLKQKMYGLLITFH